MSLEFYIASQNWPNDLAEAKEFATQAINAWKFKGKKDKFIRKIEQATSVVELQRMVCYTFLSGEGKAAIK